MRFAFKVIAVFLLLASFPGLCTQAGADDKTIETQPKWEFKRVTRWQPTSVAVLNVEKREMEAFSAFTSTWETVRPGPYGKGPRSSFEEVIILLDSNGKMTWAGWKRDVYLKIGDRIMGCYAYTDASADCCILRGRSGLDVNPRRMSGEGAHVKTNNKKKAIDGGPDLNEFDRFISHSEKALTYLRAYPTRAEKSFLLNLEHGDGVFSDESTRKSHVKTGIKYQHDDIRPNLPLTFSNNFSLPFSAQPLAQAHSILGVSMENDEICFEIQNTERQLKERVWVDRNKLLNEKIFKEVRVRPPDSPEPCTQDDADDKTIEIKPEKEFKRVTRWQPTSVAVFNADTGEMEAFPAFTSTWGYLKFNGNEEKTGMMDIYPLREMVVLTNSDGEMAWAGKQRDVYLRIRESLVGFHIYLNTHYGNASIGNLHGTFGLDVDAYRHAEKSLEGPPSSKWDRFIHETEEVHAFSLDGVEEWGHNGFFERVRQSKHLDAISKPGRIFYKKSRKSSWRCEGPGIFTSQPLSHPERGFMGEERDTVLAIRRVFVENDEICFEIQNKGLQKKGRLWIDKKALLEKRLLKLTRAMLYNGVVRISK